LNPPDISRLIDGTIRETSNGSCFVAERVYPLSYRHGQHALGEALNVSSRAIGLIARRDAPANLDLRDALFLDTETTGLSGGTGTYAFLVGVGRFEDRGFVVRQLFMRDFGEERALLSELDALCESARVLVTFNGRAFDWPLLETRYLMAARARPRLRPVVHLDLLFPARRLWRGRLESCSLGTLERAVLGHLRERDVPGWAIPALYFRYLREGDSLPMRGVFRHNLVDVLSLATLLARLGCLLGEPLSSPCGPEDLLAVGRCYEDAGFAQEATDCYEHALALTPASASRRALMTRLALLHKRRGTTDVALRLWRELATLGGDPAALVELAKHCEHRARDFLAAVDLVEQALAVVELQTLHRGDAAIGAMRRDLERRLARLLRKAATAHRVGASA
jgi:uncharacterized protein YprB with RNaseH-like and TPR domain